MVLIVAAAMAFAIFQPITVLPRMRLAPGYGMIDQSGELFTSEQTRGSVTIYNFSPLDCGERCDELADTMRTVQANVAADLAGPAELEAIDIKFVTIALEADPTPEQLATAAAATGADGEQWRWVGGTESQIQNTVGVGFRRYREVLDDGTIEFDSGYVMVDGWGVIRGDYRFRTLSDDAEKTTRHLGMLATEIRYASGPGAIAYEAAHLFSCYP